MSAFRGIRRVLRVGVVSRELDDELAFHFERTVDELTARGVPREEAEVEARRRFGDERRYRWELERIDRGVAARLRWRERWEVVRDSVVYAFRRMRRSPGFALAVVLTFALGIGANAVMFGIVDRLLLQPPAHVADADRVVRLGVERFLRGAGTRETLTSVTYLDYEDWTRAESFSSVAAYAYRDLTLGRGEAARQAEGRLVTGNFFSLLGVRPAVGRFFGPEDDRVGAPGVAVVSYGFWQREFGGSRDVLDRTVDFGYGPYAIVGVAPKNFTGVELERVDVWLPLVAAQAQMAGTRFQENRNMYWLAAVARLAPGAAPEAAEAEATAAHLQGRREQVDAGRYDAGARVMALPLIAARGPQASDESIIAKWLAGISLIVLLIACANVANLLLVRAVKQRREVGIRLALGGSRARVLGQTLTESVLLALLGGAAALLLAHWGGAFLRATLLPEVAWTEGVEQRVMAFVAGVALFAGVVAGLLPALQGSRPDVVETLKSGSRGASAPSSRLRGALTVLQAGLSVVLLVGAGLFVRSLNQVRSLDLGLDPRGVLLVDPVFDREVPDERRAEFAMRAQQRLESLPVVQHASAANSAPFYSFWAVPLRVPGLDSIPDLPGGGPYINPVDEDYFAVLDLAVVRGRGLEPTDVAGAPRVAVVDQTMARALWPGQEALGKCLIIGDDPDEPGEPPCATVVGVVENAARQRILDEPEAMQYFVSAQQEIVAAGSGNLLIRVRGDPAAAIPALQRELLAVDPGLRFADMIPLQERIDPQARSWTLGATMLSVFGLLALIVAGVGLYSVLAFSVAQRTTELGIRAALGATRDRLMTMVIGQALRLVGIGVALGIAAALLAGPRVEPLLFEVSPRDPATLAAVAAALLLVGVLAGSLPAWRATRVEPSEALRAE